MQSAVEQEKQRDLVIEMTYSDLADLDLSVTEPIGAVCGQRQPQSTGGGIWRGDRLMDQDRSEKFKETYTAAEAFSGSYEVRVTKVWGQPLSDKVTIHVTRHKGTPAETQELHRLALGSDGSAYLKVRLEDGRRHEFGLGATADAPQGGQGQGSQGPGWGLRLAPSDVRPRLFRHDRQEHDGRRDGRE